MFSDKKKVLKNLFTISAGCGRRSKFQIKDSLQTRPREQPELIPYTQSSTCHDDDGTPRDEMSGSGSASVTRQIAPMENSVAVEKHSDDPYGDFQDSILQMILEKEIYSKEDLQKLLCCFLQLNSPGHHEVIIRAFMETLTNINWTASPNN